MKKVYSLLLAAASVIPVSAAVPPPGDLEPDVSYHPGKTLLLSRDCDAFTVEAYEATHEKSYGSLVEMIEGDDGFYYLRFPVSEYPCEAYVKAEKVDNTLVIKGPQAIYEEYDYESYMVYLVPLKLQVDENDQGSYVADESMEYVFNITEKGEYVCADPTMLLGVCTYTYLPYLKEDGYYWSGYGDRDISMKEVTSETVKVPENLKTEKWVWKDPFESCMVQLGFDNDDVYIQGMDRVLPEAWIKGKVTSDNKIVFPSGQYMGPDYGFLFFHYFSGGDFVEVRDPVTDEVHTEASLAPTAIFSFDPEAKKIKTESGYLINSNPDKLYPLFFFDDVTIEVQHRNPDCPPAAPYDLFSYQNELGNSIWVQIPNTDTDGNLLDESRLYYEIFLEGEPYDVFLFLTGIEDQTTWIPYNYQDSDIYVLGTDHTVYFLAEDVELYGVRSLYINENDEVIYSAPCGVVCPSAVNAVEADIDNVTWYDLTGKVISEPAQGLAIRKVTYSDGTVKSHKVFVK